MLDNSFCSDHKALLWLYIRKILVGQKYRPHESKSLLYASLLFQCMKRFSFMMSHCQTIWRRGHSKTPWRINRTDRSSDIDCNANDLTSFKCRRPKVIQTWLPDNGCFLWGDGCFTFSQRDVIRWMEEGLNKHSIFYFCVCVLLIALSFSSIYIYTYIYSLLKMLYHLIFDSDINRYICNVVKPVGKKKDHFLFLVRRQW